MVCDTFALLGIINCNFHKSILPSFHPSCLAWLKPLRAQLGCPKARLGFPGPGSSLP